VGVWVCGCVCLFVGEEGEGLVEFLLVGGSPERDVGVGVGVWVCGCVCVCVWPRTGGFVVVDEGG
jgi:hypothetical protein